jgi:multidrug efflux pump subunit AcrA (membrane-fusion protein)
MGVRVGFLESKPAGAAPAPTVAGVLVPGEAVRPDGNDSIVFVVADDKKVQRRRVTLGPDVAGQRRVVSGLREGERVVLAPPPGLADGQAVRLGDK